MTKERGGNAKERYDKKRPVISVRVTESQKKKVEEMARITGKSVGRLVREGLGLERKEWRESYRRGYERGRDEARKRYLVKVPCGCGHYFPVVGKELIQEVEEILVFHCRWYHKNCRPKITPKSVCRLFKNPPKKSGKAAKLSD